MRRALYGALMVVTFAACSRDAAERHNPGGNPPTALEGSGVASPDNTATRALATTDTTATTTGTMPPTGTTTTTQPPYTTTTGAPQP